jgi:hypothetical protein
MTPIDLVRLTALRDRTSGSPDVVVGLIDGPVAVDRPDLANENISPIPGKPGGRGRLREELSRTILRVDQSVIIYPPH